ncbi:MAG: hypothetical protein K2W85_02605 [Phycisphaerales bacterium]|nr:hypothetical protein [Phycisphaerales bacterium]
MSQSPPPTPPSPPTPPNPSPIPPRPAFGGSPPPQRPRRKVITARPEPLSAALKKSLGSDAPEIPPAPEAKPAVQPPAIATAPATQAVSPAATDAPVGAESPNAAQLSGFDKRIIRPTLHPRRVVGGFRLNHRPPTVADMVVGNPEEPDRSSGWTWAAARWMRIVEERAPGDQLAEGFEYARAGQTRSIDIRSGMISARVQGRMPQAYKTSVRLPAFTPEQWDKVLSLMIGQAKYAASLLAGELPSNIEDMFAPAGLSLFPADASDLSCSCECDVFTGRVTQFAPGGGVPMPPPAAPPPTSSSRKGKSGGPVGVQFCKHVCCTMYLVADRLASSPLSIFMLRGLPEQDLLERLRQARALQGLARAGVSAAPVYTPHVSGVGAAPTPLDADLDPAGFWSSEDPDALSRVDMPIARPEVSHPLLRRVGPSPFTGAKFPITGLLATCYDVISETVIRETTGRQGSPRE